MIENEYKKYIDEKLPVPDIKARVKSRIQFKKKEGLFSMKKLGIALTSVASVAAVTGIIVGVCVFNTQNQKTDVKNACAVVNMDVNPSIEFVVDSKNKVVSVKGLNDEGQMIIYGEALVGKDINDAIKAVVKVETETGYLVANGELSQNTISLSVSADDGGYVKELGAKIQQAAKDACQQYNVNANVEKVQKYTKDQMVALAMQYDSTLTKEEAEKMTYEGLAKVIALYHVETAEIYGEKLEELYVQARDNDIECAKFEPVANAINSADTIYKALLKAYGEVIETLQTYYDSLENLTYTTFVDPESDYQKALKSVQDAKDDVLKYRTEIAACDHNNEAVYNGLVSYLDAADLLLDTKKAALETVEAAGTTAIETYRGMIQATISTLRTIEKALPSNVSDYLNSKVGDLDTAINTAKKEAFNEFEKAHKADIDRAKLEVKNHKDKLKADIKNGTAEVKTSETK